MDTIERTCVFCGCTDSKACVGGCAWAIKFPYANSGVCTRCSTIQVESALSGEKNPEWLAAVRRFKKTVLAIDR